MERRYYVYILTNRHHTVLYTGVTGNLVQRVHEEAADAAAAIAREKQIKAGSRRKKVALFIAMNPEWRDLYNDLL